MERKIIGQLKLWKDHPERKPLILLGCMTEAPASQMLVGDNVRARSMSEYIKSHPEYSLKGLRISMLGYQDQDWMENIPLYAISKYFK